MQTTHSILLTGAATLLLGSVMPVIGQQGASVTSREQALEKQLVQLRRQNRALQASLADANRSSRENASALASMKDRLASLGRSVFGTRDESLIEANNAVAALSSRNQEIEQATHALVGDIQAYLRTAVASDPDLRLKVEESIRNLDSVLGLRQKPRPQVAVGTLKDAKVTSVDSESGMLVFNIGQDAGARIGMTFTLRRGGQTLGEATIVDVRSTVSGAFVDTLIDQNINARHGDTVSLKTVNRP